MSAANIFWILDFGFWIKISELYLIKNYFDKIQHYYLENFN